MVYVKNLMVVFLFLTVSLACSSRPTHQQDEQEEIDSNSALVARFNQGLTELEAERYKAAARILDGILVAKPASEFDLIAMYNSGAAYEGMGDCQTAGRRYRQVAQTARGRYSRLEAQAMFRLSYAYECMNMPTRVVATLLDVEKRKDQLPPEIAEAELPARLAVAYAQMSEFNAAEKHFEMAEAGIKRLRRLYKDRSDVLLLLARTYYFMGRVSERKVNPESAVFLKGLRYHQMHLIKAVELDVQPWSDKAVKSVLQGYRDLFVFMNQGLEQMKRDKKSYNEIREYVIGWTDGGLQALAELKSLRFPATQESAGGRRMFADLETEEGRLRQVATDYAITQPLTTEAENREGLKRTGRIKSGVTVLEEEAQQRKATPASKRQIKR